ncbi:MAG: MFS transporter [Gammaproteobacteria bacterium]
MKLLTPKVIIYLIGAISGAAMQMNWMANGSLLTEYVLLEAIFRLAAGAIFTAFVFWRIHLWTMNRAGNEAGETRCRQLEFWNACSFAPALIVLLGINGTMMTREFAVVIIGAVIGLNLLAHMLFNSKLSLLKGHGSLGILFLISGFAALIYQLSWQRVLFATFGVDMESVTLVVSVFMFGLGIGSIIGGIFSERFPGRLREMFFACEVLTGIFGLASIAIIRGASDVAIHGSFLTVAMTIFAILCLPTMMMGATLPILVTYINRERKNVGSSVGWLYFVNTVGSALAALLTVTLIFPAIGLQGAVWTAAVFNFLVAWLVIQNTRTASSVSSPVSGEVA